MTSTIKIYGTLRKICGVKEFYADVSNVDQVFSFLKVNFPQCKQHLIDAFYSVQIDQKDVTFLGLVFEGQQEIKIIPVISGNFWFFGALAKWFTSSAVTSALLSIGATIGLNYLASLFAPVPIEPATDPQVASFLSNQTANTTKAGGAAPLVFGECIVGSVVISAASDTVNIVDSHP